MSRWWWSDQSSIEKDARIAELEAANERLRKSLHDNLSAQLEFCRCEDPLIRCDDRGCNCVLCGRLAP